MGILMWNKQIELFIVEENSSQKSNYTSAVKTGIEG